MATPGLDGTLAGVVVSGTLKPPYAGPTKVL
jgi:hypothetical protein